MQNFRLQVDQQHTNMSLPTIFSGGEVHIDLSNQPTKCHDWSLKARCQSGDDIMHMLMFVDALKRRYPDASGSVTVPYLPYARQDRMCADGQHFGLSVMVNLLRTLGHVRLITHDTHSEVANDLLHASGVIHTIIPQWKIISSDESLFNALCDDKMQIVAPDKGALDKCKTLKNITGNNLRVAVGEKTRNPSTGQITGFTCDVEDFEGRDILIPDDICDGGGTFIGLASLLKERNCGKITLYVTHGIFSKGFAIFEGVIDEIVTTSSFRREERPACFRGTVGKSIKFNTINFG